MTSSNGSRSPGFATPVLTLDDVELERPCVEIKGVLYGYVNPRDMNVMEQVRLDKLSHQFTKLQRAIDNARRDLADAYDDDVDVDTTAYEQLLQALHDRHGDAVRLVVPDMPDDVLDGLPTASRAAIVESFGLARGVANSPAPETTTTPATIEPLRPLRTTTTPGLKRGTRSSLSYARPTRRIRGSTG